MRKKVMVWSSATAAVCLLMFLVGFMALIGPQRDHADELVAQKENAQSTFDTLDLRLASLKSQVSQLPAQKAQIAQIDKQIPATVDLPALIRDIDRIADESGVTISSLTPGAPVAVVGTDAAAVAGVSSVPISIAVSGEVFETSLFLKSLQGALSRAVLVTQVALDLSDDLASGSDVKKLANLTVQGQVFVLAKKA